ncbi:MAG TPA: class I SAM-dependent methyltransferase [Kofleriaceae bacterium]|nr:class I SAM-dependent methyltransferase [Kofleriaceae bacterium]
MAQLGLLREQVLGVAGQRGHPVAQRERAGRGHQAAPGAHEQLVAERRAQPGQDAAHRRRGHADPLHADWRRLYGELAADAYLPIGRAGGELLYTLARARDARTIVEFGTSFGLSTIYLAAALADAGGGRLITTELSEAKAAAARRNLERAGLAQRVEIRVGDALDTLADLPGGVDLLYLDGAKSLYRRVLGLVEPRLAPHAIVAADNIDMVELVGEFTRYVRDPANGYASNRVVAGEALEVAVRT